jgi:N utilization substance protein B
MLSLLPLRKENVAEIPNNKFREIVFQVLFSRCEGDEIVSLLMRELKVTRKAVKQAIDRALKVRAEMDQIDQMIADASISFALDRIRSVELTALRLGVYEIKFDEEIPPKVAITEAVRLVRKFSTREATSFVNAVLDHIYKGESVDAVEEASLDLAAAEEAAQEEPLQEEE